MQKKLVLKSKARFISFLFILSILLVTAIGTTKAYSYKYSGYSYIVISKGDTLWSISKEYSNDKDVRKFVHQIKKINNLSNSEIFEGMRVKIPAK